MTQPIRGSVGAPPLSHKEVVDRAEAFAERFLLDFWKGRVNPKLVGISFDAVYEHVIYPEYNIVLIEDLDLGCHPSGEKIWGKYEPHSNTAYVDCSLRNDPRREFTCWHEVGGHGILQGDWLRSRAITVGAVVTTQSTLSPLTVNALERQANIFAAHAAVPTKLLAHVWVEMFDPDGPMEYRGPGPYTFHVNHRVVRREIEDFNHYAWTAASFLRRRFGWISAECISYRLQDIKVIKDCTVSNVELHRVAKGLKQISGAWFQLPMRAMSAFAS
jgi:hypothetical protein